MDERSADSPPLLTLAPGLGFRMGEGRKVARAGGPRGENLDQSVTVTIFRGPMAENLEVSPCSEVR